MSSACELILVRHGETAWNRERRLQGHIDVALNEEGLWQARAVARALAVERLDALYSSDLTRARQTAQAIALASGLTLTQEAALRERSYGVFEGVPLAALAQRFPREHEEWRQRVPDAVIAGAETLRAFTARVESILLTLAERHVGQTVVVVTHGGFLDAAYRIAAGIGIEQERRWDLLNASVNRIRREGAHWRVRAWADVTHLQTAGALDEVEARAPSARTD